MLYRLDDSEWSVQLPTAKNAGEYTVWYKVQGNAEYANVAEQNVTCLLYTSIVAERTHSTVVQVIGKKIVLYKESKDHKKIELPL